MLKGRRQRENSVGEREPEATEVEGNDEGSNYGRAETVVLHLPSSALLEVTPTTCTGPMSLWIPTWL